MKKFKTILLLILFCIPIIVFAEEGNDDIPFLLALFMEAFVTIHISLFVLNPLSKIINEKNPKKLFWTLFVIRIIILLFFDFFITTMIAVADFIGVFVGGFIIVPITALIFKKRSTKRSEENNLNSDNWVIKCNNCGQLLDKEEKICPNCKELIENNVTYVQKNIDT